MPTRTQESNYATCRLAKMSLAIRGIDAQIAQGDTFHDDHHPDLNAGYMLANPSSTTATGGGSSAPMKTGAQQGYCAARQPCMMR